VNRHTLDVSEIVFFAQVDFWRDLLYGPDGTFEKSEPSPSAMVGWTRTASRSLCRASRHHRFDFLIVAVRRRCCDPITNLPVFKDEHSGKSEIEKHADQHDKLNS
jgi:hypothetical protein